MFCRWLHSATATPTTTLLRPYQRQCVDTCLRDFLERGVGRQAVSLPVGSGKTLVMAALIDRLPAPTAAATKSLVLAHRHELLSQAARQIRRLNPRLRVAIESAAQHADVSGADVVVASVQALGKRGSTRIAKYDPALFKAVMIDEAHHAAASTYRRVLRHFGLHEPRPAPAIFLWGCSATVMRHDGLKLGAIFDDIVYHYDMHKMIDENWLCKLATYTIRTDVELNGITCANGDYSLALLGKLVNCQERNAKIVREWMRYRTDLEFKSTLAFAVNIDHAEKLAQAFLDGGIDAAVITSKTGLHERRDILAAFTRREIPVLVNCGILTEGTDVPSIDCLLMARPTRSRILYQQMLGRGMRLYPGKTRCYVLDFVDNCTKNVPVTAPTLLGVDPNDIAGSPGVRQKTDKKSAKPPLLEIDTIGVAMKCIREGWDPLTTKSNDFCPSLTSPFSWINLYDGRFVLNFINGDYLIAKRSPADSEKFVTVRMQKLEKSGQRFFKERALPIESNSLVSVVNATDTFLKSDPSVNAGFLLRRARWRSEQGSEAQVKYVKRLGSKVFSASALGHLHQLTKGELELIITLLRFGKSSMLRKVLESKAQ